MSRTINDLPADSIEACSKSAASLTADDLKTLHEWDPKIADERREDKSRAIQAILAERDEEDRRQQKAAPPKQSQSYARSFSAAAAKELNEAVLNDPRALLAWGERHAKESMPVLAAVALALRFRAESAEHHNRLLERVKALEARYEEVQTRGVNYRGVHQLALEYKRGDATTWDGSLWICIADSTRARPGASDDSRSRDWQLAVRRGRDGRDARSGRGTE